jgi:hypothetical protein
VDLIEYLPNLRENRITLFVYYGMRALVFVASVMFAVGGDWSLALIAILVFVVMLVPSLLKRQWRLYLPFALDFSIVLFLFCTLLLGQLLRFYQLVPWWDKFLHFQSGLLLSVTGFVLVYILNEHEKSPLDLSPGFLALFAVTFAITFGALWELWEYGIDILFHTYYWQGGSAVSAIGDTMDDLLADTIGAIIVSTIGYFWMYRYKRLPMTPWFLRLLRRKRKHQ